MKSTLLFSSLAIAACSALAAPIDPVAQATPTPPAKPAVSASSHVTITIDSGGKKVTREMDLGSAPTVKIHGPVTVKVEGGAGGNSIAATTAPWLGVAPDEVSEDLRAQLPLEEGTGLILRNVTTDSPAAQAGLQKNDVLVKFDDQLLTNAKQLRTLVHTKKDGDKVRLTYFRGGKSFTTEAQIRMHAGDEPGNDPWNISSFLSSVINGASNVESKMVVTDKDGHVLVTSGQPDLGGVIAQIEKILRAAGVDDKTITEAKGAIAEAAKTASGVAASIGSADGEVTQQIKNTTDQIAKSLGKVRAAAEQARKQAEEAGERAREQVQKQSDPQKTPGVQ
jgi:membrane-associated protease RseP (regulator of RpoE activity)